MTVKVNFLTPLLRTTEGNRAVYLESETVGQVIQELGDRFPRLIDTICDETGGLKNNVSIYLNDNDIRFFDGIQTVVNDGDELYIVPTIAGG